ncbi:MAG: excinuclease ABC subunit UvrA [Bacteroidales bacterium]|nr:excinuclease ABC subunit UvrA [Bacteroidales bacterium]
MSSEKNIRNIVIVRARVNNLKNLSVTIPHNKLVVITGLSGSGKSSLAFDTLYAEGQRRYVESLSSYARQFLGRMNKPDVDQITGISPAIAIEQKVNSRNPRSTVGTSTEIYEYIKLLFSRIGKTISPVSGKVVKRHQVSDVVDFTINLKSGTQVLILSPFQVNHNRQILDHLTVLLQQGFNRVLADGDLMKIEDILKDNAGFQAKELFIVVDRIRVNPDDKDLPARIADSVQTAFYEGHGSCVIQHDIDGQTLSEIFSNKFEADGIVFEEPSVNMFTFNNPFGACRTCEGFGSIIGIDPDLVIPNKALSVYEGAVACWKGEKMGEWKDKLVTQAEKFGFPVHKPYYQLNTEQKELLWTGNEYFDGLNDFFRQVEEQTYKIQYRVMLSRYRGKTICPDCLGTRLRKDANYVKIDGFSISELVMMPVDKLLEHFSQLKLNKHDLQVADRLIKEITTRLSFLVDVGLGYLTLNRLSNTLSGGESQRINLATSLGSSLVGSTYILDEPSIGLHSRDTQRLIKILRRLRDIGNTVLIVEHDEEIIKAADQVIDIGPLAGSQGGELVFQGSYHEIIQSDKSLTGAYLSGRMKIEIPKVRRKWVDYIEITGASENNLKNLDVKFPLKIMTMVTGVSGSGKSSLVRGILYPALKKHLGGHADKTGQFGELKGDLRQISGVEMIDQNPIGRSTRSNPATYVKAFDDIRQMFAEQRLAKTRGYKPGFFSFNVPGGRCDACEGEGVVKIEMQFMADVFLICDQCKGNRYKEEVLDVKFQQQSIADILSMTIDDAIDFFDSHSKLNNSCHRIVSKLKPLQDVGLGYLQLGQSSSTLSGGEAQRIKLAFFLTKGQVEKPTLFIFDEPTTGLHFHDISKLLDSLNALIENGHTVIVIEHNNEMIKSADWIVDLGPEGGDKGGQIQFEGTPEDMVKVNKSYTALALLEKIRS